MQKNRYARAKLLFCQFKPLQSLFLTFLLLSPSSLLNWAPYYSGWRLGRGILLCHFKNLYQHSATNLFYYYFRYFPFLVLRKAYSSITELTLRIFYQSKQADFVAYFRQDFPDILSLICCPSHLTGKVIDDLEEKEITPIYGSSDIDMIPGHDRAFVHVSEGISPFNEKDMKDLYLM